MQRVITFLTVFGAILIIIDACKSDSAEPDFDKSLFTEVNAAGYTYYQGGNLLTGVSPSTHGSFKLRFNATAAAALDGTGELPVGGTFPTGSILVKEVHTSGNPSLYAVIKKDPTNKYAASGWIWAELNIDGSVVVSVKTKGASCVSCHSEAPNRDLSKTFDLH